MSGAEAAGLAVGVIALASLFTTCIEILDYFELGRNYQDDYDIACTKLNLLQVRLSTWGKATQIQQRGREHPSLKDPSNRDAVSSSLTSLHALLTNTETLRKKYDLCPEKHLIPQRHCRYRRATYLSLNLRRRTTWSIRDKGKFDRFIADISFLVENMEKVVEITERMTRTRLVCEEQQAGMNEDPDSKALSSRRSKYFHQATGGSQAVLCASKPPPGQCEDASPASDLPSKAQRVGDAVQEAIANAIQSSQLGAYIADHTQTNRGAIGWQGVLDPSPGVTAVVQRAPQVNEAGTIAFQGTATSEGLARLYQVMHGGKGKGNEER